MTGSYDGQRQVKSILSRRYIISIYAKRKSYYISKCLRRRLEGQIRLRLDPQNRYCLILEQERNGKASAVRGCAELWKTMEETMQLKQDARFLFFPTEDKDRWVGYLLPDWNNPILWKEMFLDETEADPSAFDGATEKKRAIVWQMKNRYWGLLDCEDVEFLWKIGKSMADRMDVDPAVWNILSVFYANELIQKDVREIRRAKAAESDISMNRKQYLDSRAEVGERLGAHTGNFENYLIVKDFINKLTVLERFLLRKLETEEDIFVSCNMGMVTKRIFTQTLDMLRYKTIEYFGKSYIESFFARS